MNRNFCRKLRGGTVFTCFRGERLRGVRLGDGSLLLRAFVVGVTGLFIYADNNMLNILVRANYAGL
jgi:hypothetical protein